MHGSFSEQAALSAQWALRNARQRLPSSMRIEKCIQSARLLLERAALSAGWALRNARWHFFKSHIDVTKRKAPFRESCAECTMGNEERTLAFPQAVCNCKSHTKREAPFRESRAECPMGTEECPLSIPSNSMQMRIAYKARSSLQRGLRRVPGGH